VPPAPAIARVIGRSRFWNAGFRSYQPVGAARPGIEPLEPAGHALGRCEIRRERDSDAAKDPEPDAAASKKCRAQHGVAVNEHGHDGPLEHPKWCVQHKIKTSHGLRVDGADGDRGNEAKPKSEQPADRTELCGGGEACVCSCEPAQTDPAPERVCDELGGGVEEHCPDLGTDFVPFANSVRTELKPLIRLARRDRVAAP